MRTLSATLEAAQRVSPQQPRVRLLVEDHQPRVVLLGGDTPSDCQMDLCVPDDGAVVAVKLDTDGKIWYKRVTDPSTWSSSGGWNAVSWTELTDQAFPWHDDPYCGDVCISNNSGTLRIFYISAGGDDVMCRSSSNHGASWGSAVKVKNTNYKEYRWCLASAGEDDVWFWNTDQYDVHRMELNGSWGSEQDYAGLEDCTGSNYVYGLSVLKVGSDYYIFAAMYDSGLVNGRIICLSRAWTESPPQCLAYEPWKVVPPFRGTAVDGWQPFWPKVIATPSSYGQSYLLSYLEKYTVGATEMYNRVVIRSNDLDHWSDPVPVPFGVTYERRLPLAAASSSVWLYADHEAAEMRHHDSEETRSGLTIGHDRVLSYRMSEDPDKGELVAEVDNRDGEYDGAGDEDDSAEALAPLARVIVDQGLVTSSGTERLESRPYYIWEVGRRRRPGENWLRIRAFDPWHLFRLWRPQATLVATDQTLQWCIEELAARVGFFDVEFDDTANWSDTLSTLTFSGDTSDWSNKARMRAWQRWVNMTSDEVLVVDERETGLTLLRTFLSLVGGAARWGNGDDPDCLYCFIPGDQGDDPATAHTYNDGEILAGEYSETVIWPTRARVAGDGVCAEALDGAAGGYNGREFVTFVTDTSIDGADWCAAVAEGALDDGEARGQAGSIETRPNVGLEVLDVIALSDSYVGAAGISSVKRRVNRIVTEYDPLRGIWRQVVGLEHV